MNMLVASHCSNCSRVWSLLVDNMPNVLPCKAEKVPLRSPSDFADVDVQDLASVDSCYKSLRSQRGQVN
jgi:hypothetical protein